jgi:hypothetical protein
MRLFSILVLSALASACAPGAPAGCDFDLVHFNDPLGGELLQLRSAEACVKLVRRDLSEPDVIYKARPWALESMTVSHAEGHEELTDDLEWISTHHNWRDEALGSGALYDYRVEVTYGRLDEDAPPGEGDYGWSYTLTGTGEDGEVALGPLDLDG